MRWQNIEKTGLYLQPSQMLCMRRNVKFVHQEGHMVDQNLMGAKQSHFGGISTMIDWFQTR